MLPRSLTYESKYQEFQKNINWTIFFSIIILKQQQMEHSANDYQTHVQSKKRNLIQPSICIISIVSHRRLYKCGWQQRVERGEQGQWLAGLHLQMWSSSCIHPGQQSRYWISWLFPCRRLPQPHCVKLHKALPSPTLLAGIILRPWHTALHTAIVLDYWLLCRWLSIYLTKVLTNNLKSKMSSFREVTPSDVTGL